jgi:hypothetical protein
MKKMHIAAIVCFVIAALLYAIGNAIAIGVVALGILLEIFAWVIWIDFSNTKQ